MVTGYTKEKVVRKLLRKKKARQRQIRDLVINEDRLDILAFFICGFRLATSGIHHQMIDFVKANDEAMILAFRGAAKSTLITVYGTILDILKNRDTTVLLASETVGASQAFLRQVKRVLRYNEEFIETFGEYYSKEEKWDQTEIIVKGAKLDQKESTVTCTGADSQVVGKHYLRHYVDDLVTERNSRTAAGREQVQTFYYKVLEPTMLSRGKTRILGTRYYPKDLYGHFIKNEYADNHLIIPLLNEENESNWIEEFPTKKYLKKRNKYFESQMQQNPSGLEGDIFIEEWMYRRYGAIPADARVWVGVDPAISKKKGADFFAIVALAVDPKFNYYVIDYFEGKISFTAQLAKINDYYELYDPIAVGVESNAYQKVLYNEMKRVHPHVRVVPVYTDLDKETRGHKLSVAFEGEQFSFKDNQQSLIDHLVSFPNGEHDDLFDALYNCYHLSVKGIRKKRVNEPGVL